MKKILLVTVLVSTLVLTGCSWTQKTSTQTSTTQAPAAAPVAQENDTQPTEALVGTPANNEQIPAQAGSTEEVTTTSTDVIKNEEAMEKEDLMVKKDPASYQNYSAAAVSSALKAGKKVALFFYAPRCPSCRSLEKEINAGLSSLPENTVLFKVDYDSSKDLKTQYGVRSQTTIVGLNQDASLKGKVVAGGLSDVVNQLK